MDPQTVQCVRNARAVTSKRETAKTHAVQMKVSGRVGVRGYVKKHVATQFSPEAGRVSKIQTFWISVMTFPATVKTPRKRSVFKNVVNITELREHGAPGHVLTAVVKL